MIPRFIQPSAWALFYKLFANLLAAGYPPAEALSQMARDPPFQQQRLLKKVRSRLAALPPAASLADCLKLPVFALDAATLDLFEKTAHVDGQVNLLHALSARHAQADWVNQLRGFSLRAMLMYLVFAGFILFTITLSVLPAIAGFYESFDAELPASTRLLMALGDWPILFVVLLGVVFAGVVLRQMRRDALFDRLGQITPLGALLKKVALTRFMHMVAVLLSKNLPARQAIIMAIPAADNAVIEQRLQRAFAAMPAGPPDFDAPLSAANLLQSSALIPADFVAVLQIAEKTKKLEEALPELVEAAAGLLARQTNVLNILGDTLAKIVVVLFLGWIALAVYEPLFKIGSMV